jgi:hypothetical protein
MASNIELTDRSESQWISNCFLEEGDESVEAWDALSTTHVERRNQSDLPYRP